MPYNKLCQSTAVKALLSVEGVEGVKKLFAFLQGLCFTSKSAGENVKSVYYPHINYVLSQSTVISTVESWHMKTFYEFSLN